VAVSAGAAGVVTRGLVRPRQGLITASGWTALLTAAVAIWVAVELRVTGGGWLPWVACAVPPAAAGAWCLARRRISGAAAPVAVFASCAAACGSAVQVPAGRDGIVLAAAVLLVACAGVAVVISAVVTGVMIGIAGAVSRRRAAVWMTAGLVFAALSIPNPVRFAGSPIQTIFAGNTGGEDAAAVCSLVLVAVPLLVAGLASARMAAIMALWWLPEAAARPLGWYIYPSTVLRLDWWYAVIWIAWLAVAVLAFTQAAHDRRARPQAGRPLAPGR
jgi:hypothetical protein